jgi:hypothetical protein
LGDFVEMQECNKMACPEWGEWSNWSKCVNTETKIEEPCGKKERFRVCDGDGKCPGETFDYFQCDCGKNFDFLRYYLSANYQGNILLK